VAFKLNSNTFYETGGLLVGLIVTRIAVSLARPKNANTAKRASAGYKWAPEITAASLVVVGLAAGSEKKYKAFGEGLFDAGAAVALSSVLGKVASAGGADATKWFWSFGLAKAGTAPPANNDDQVTMADMWPNAPINANTPVMV